MKPVSLDIISQTLTTFDHCSHCNLIFDQAGWRKKFQQRDIEDYPAELKEEFARLAEWVKELSHLYQHRLRIRLIDAQSPLGMLKAFLHRVRRYPGFIVEGKHVYSGWDRDRLEELIDGALKPAQTQKQSE